MKKRCYVKSFLRQDTSSPRLAPQASQKGQRHGLHALKLGHRCMRGIIYFEQLVQARQLEDLHDRCGNGGQAQFTMHVLSLGVEGD